MQDDEATKLAEEIAQRLEERVMKQLITRIDENAIKSHLARGKTESELFKSLESRIRDCIREEVNKLREEVQPVVQWFSHVTWARRVILSILIAISTLAGAMLAAKQIIKNFFILK